MSPQEARTFLIQITDLLPVTRTMHQRALDAIEALFNATRPVTTPPEAKVETKSYGVREDS